MPTNGVALQIVGLDKPKTGKIIPIRQEAWPRSQGNYFK